MQQVREKSNATAFVVQNKKGEHVATVHYFYGSGGGVQCDVWARKAGETWLSLVHQKKASGYGYDKAAAALSGATIEGYTMANHCGNVEPEGEKKRDKLLAAYKKATARGGLTKEQEAVFIKKAERIGCRFANYTKQGFCDHFADKDFYSYKSLHNEQGLERLRVLGFSIIQAI